MRARERPTRALEPVKMRRCYIIITIATLLYGLDTCTLIVLQSVSEYALRNTEPACTISRATFAVVRDKPSLVSI